MDDLFLYPKTNRAVAKILVYRNVYIQLMDHHGMDDKRGLG
jgi:hypothetical protein